MLSSCLESFVYGRKISEEDGIVVNEYEEARSHLITNEIVSLRG